MVLFIIKRPAIAMIELIFAIVIIGFVLMSAPLLMQSAAKSGYVAIQQEAINEAASDVSVIMGKFWDERIELEPRIILGTAGHADLNELNISGMQAGRRAGTPERGWRKFVEVNGTARLDATSVANLGSDGGDDDDIDDYNGVLTHSREIEAAVNDYIEKFTIDINTNVTYVSDAPSGSGYQSGDINFSINFTPSANATNIKGITATLTSSSGIDELNKTIVLRGFCCNVDADPKFNELISK